jgi:nucleotide-binding universal stress UspA family protein
MTTSSTSRQKIPTQRPATIHRLRVVVGVDDSYWGRIALRWAADYSALTDAALYVYAPSPDSGDDLSGADAFRALSVTPALVRADDDAATALISASRQADLVVLGCRSQHQHGIGVGAAVLPVAAGAGCDVAVIGGRPDTALASHRSVSVQVGTDADTLALRSAARLAALRRVPLRIVLPLRAAFGEPTHDSVDRHFAVLDRAANVVRAVEPAVRISTDLAWLSTAAPVGAPADTDVLVIGVRHGLTPLARAALYHARCPVLIARASTAARHQVNGLT